MRNDDSRLKPIDPEDLEAVNGALDEAYRAEQLFEQALRQARREAREQKPNK